MMKHLQWAIVIVGIAGLLAVLIFPPWVATPTHRPYPRLSQERMGWWPFGDWRVDKFDLWTELFAIAGLTGSIWSLLEMRKRRRPKGAIAPASGRLKRIER